MFASVSNPRLNSHLLVLFLILESIRAIAASESTLPESPDDYIPLFNGYDLEGFYSWLVDTQYEDPRQVFAVVDRQIRISGDGLGYLATGQIFENYDLILEYRWGTRNTRWGDRIGKARDSGLFLNAIGSDGNSVDGRGAFMAAIECNIFQGATGDILLIRGESPLKKLIAPEIKVITNPTRDQDGWYTWDPNGQQISLKRMGRINWLGKSNGWRDELDFRGLNDPSAPYGDWNRLEVQCRPNKISIRLNGHLINRITPLFPQSGRILLQCEGSEIFFRRMDIRLLSGSD